MMEPIKIQLEIWIKAGGQVEIDRITARPYTDLPEVPTMDHAQVTQIKISCYHFHNLSGDKERDSCDGCKVAGCSARGRYKGEPIVI